MNDLSTPRAGIHSYRIPGLDIAVVDTVATLAASYAICKYTGWPFWATTIALFGVAQGFHHVYNINTPIHQKLMDLVGQKMPDDNDKTVISIPENNEYIKGSCPMEHLWKSC